ncbi:MAG: carbon-nitrogen hydrolase [Gammaproteobacteria bacterium]|nr:carbon-nitrogen hydrolase [Gammaproteobacteria bacterium]
MSQAVLPTALIQMRCSAEPADNLQRALGLARKAAQNGARLICLPELFQSRYFCQSEDSAQFSLAEPVPGPGSEAFAGLAAEFDATIVISLFERRAPGLFHNTAAVLDGRKGYAGKYRKMHIPDDPRFYEKYYFTPGDLGFRSFATGAGNLGVLICWDQWYPEAARLTALKGAEILIYPTAIGWQPEEKARLGERQHAAWELMQRAHAVANGCFVLAINRTGFEPDPTGNGGLEFWGQSFAVAPDGRILARGPADAEAILELELNLAEIEAFRIGWPFLRDRRIDAYDNITQRFSDS